MRWTLPVWGETRIRDRFLWWPKNIRGEKRWWEQARWMERYDSGGFWDSIKWLEVEERDQ